MNQDGEVLKIFPTRICTFLFVCIALFGSIKATKDKNKRRVQTCSNGKEWIEIKVDVSNLLAQTHIV